MSLFDEGKMGPGPRGKGRIRAVRGSLASLESKSVGGVDFRKKKIRDRRRLVDPENLGDLTLGDLAGEPAKNPNELTEVIVRLPLSMIIAAGGPGDKLNALVYEGVRAGLAQRGIKWFGPRFLARIDATRMRRAESKHRFTL